MKTIKELEIKIRGYVTKGIGSKPIQFSEYVKALMNKGETNAQLRALKDVLKLIDGWFDGRGNMEKWEWNELKSKIEG